MGVREMLCRIDSRELTEWMAFAKMEPFGEERADLRSGIICSTMANIKRDTKKKREPYKAFDFMPYRNKGGEEKKVSLSEVIKANFRNMK